VSLLLRAGYYYSHAIGVNNFELDWRTGRVFKSTRSTLYTMATNIIVAILIGLAFIGKAKFIDFDRFNKLYEYFSIIATKLRITAGLAILFNQWRYQHQLIILARKVIKICLARPQIIRIYSWRILCKFLNGFTLNIFPFIITFAYIGYKDFKVFPAMFLHLWVSAIINLATTQYFLVMLCVRAQYNLLNAELKQVIGESKYLSYNPSRKGAFMTRCCTLADQVDDIAKLQDNLQSIVSQLDAIFGVQKMVMYCSFYVYSVVTSYSVYNLIKHDTNNLGMNVTDIFLCSTWSIIFLVDAIHNLFMEFHVQDGHQDMIRLLDERTLFASGLDARLEESFEILQLQLIRNPFKLNVFQLFTINRGFTYAMFASIVLHSIYLVQYDLENF
ncbi:hypothetical protein KR032_009560, partial [Drosophila birchii]